MATGARGPGGLCGLHVAVLLDGDDFPEIRQRDIRYAPDLDTLIICLEQLRDGGYNDAFPAVCMEYHRDHRPVGPGGTTVVPSLRLRILTPEVAGAGCFVRYAFVDDVTSLAGCDDSFVFDL